MGHKSHCPVLRWGLILVTGWSSRLNCRCSLCRALSIDLPVGGDRWRGWARCEATGLRSCTGSPLRRTLSRTLELPLELLRLSRQSAGSISGLTKGFGLAVGISKEPGIRVRSLDWIFTAKLCWILSDASPFVEAASRICLAGSTPGDVARLRSAEALHGGIAALASLHFRCGTELRRVVGHLGSFNSTAIDEG